MAKITKLYDTPPYQEQDSSMKDYKKKLFRHRAGVGARYLVCAVVIACGCLAFNLWSQNKTYTSYETVATAEHSSTVNTMYTEYNGKLLKYSKDGISCLGSGNEAVWSQTYNMQNPMVDICQSAVAVADRQGNAVYVFDAQGVVTEISTLLPIQQISVSAQGVTAILLNDSDVSWIYLYDKEGNKLAESRAVWTKPDSPFPSVFHRTAASWQYPICRCRRARQTAVWFSITSVPWEAILWTRSFLLRYIAIPSFPGLNILGKQSA